MPTPDIAPDEIEAWVGQETGVSEWVTVDATRVAQFAECTEDFQFIHLDDKAAKEAGFAGPIVHGFLVLSLLSRFAYEASARLDNCRVSINYGFEKVRFLSPVLTGSDVRARFVLTAVSQKRPGQWLMTHDVSIEVKAQEKPAIVAQWLTLLIVDG
ncbi:MAG: MaoC family dehydratase [Gammaproteobacteria bacterium]